MAVRTFTSVVDASRTSLYRFSKRRFRSNFGPPGGLPACLPLPDSNLFPPFLCPFKHFRLRVLILLCKSTNESFENIVIAIEIFSRILKRIAIRIRVLKFTNFLYLEKNYALNTRLEEMEEL